MSKTFYTNIYFAAIIFFFFLIFGTISKADTISQLQDKIDIANKNKAALEKEIANYQNQLKDIGEQATTLQNTIKSLDISTNKITTEVKLTENNINKTAYTITDTSLEINDKERQINLGKLAIIESLRQINEQGYQSTLELMLSDKNFSDLWTELENNIQIQDKIGDQVATVKTIKTDLEKAKTELEIKKRELEEYNQELTDRKQVLLSTKKEKSTLLVNTKNTEANYQKILKDKLALKEALDQEINSFESQLKLAIDPKSFPPAGKGILAWPLSGTIRITQNFGKTADSGRLYTSGTHNGVDFAATIGTPVKSAGNGVVEGVGDTDITCPGASFGKWVFIRYNNGLASTYGHFSVISAKVGQKVKTGDIVGYSGNTGYSTGPHLHMSVYASQGVKISTLKSSVCKGTYTIPVADIKAYLDPLIYL
jgi:murein DD-endopeptidase MepM/ murein hydrolase activator NlpD